MAFLLRFLLLIMLISLCITVLSALHLVDLNLNHIKLAIPTFIYVIFIQAFIMFYFIGVDKLIKNIYEVLFSNGNLKELFDEAPSDLEPYKKKTKKYLYDSTLAKRQTIPWTMLMLILGSIGFLMGGAHDTGMVRKVFHSGIIYGFLASVLIGAVKQWKYLGRSYKLLREVKALFSMSNDSM